MTHFITLFLLSIGSYFTAPALEEVSENKTAITVVEEDKGDGVIRMGGTGNWDGE